MFTAVMFIIGYVESLLPPIFSVPGIKPGFANIPVMIAIYILDWKLAAAMSFTRIILSGFTFTGLFACIYSLAGAVLSITVMVILKRTGKFSVTGVSIAGGVAHNLGQVIVASIVVGKAIWYYFPVLVIAGLVAGALTGVVTGCILKINQRDGSVIEKSKK
ncbi:MAG: Gx transporter family protein [Lachnospiraceae bacterium]|nr:Gx transporter family protein [Lachnospiraceae bacterium]